MSRIVISFSLLLLIIACNKKIESKYKEISGMWDWNSSQKIINGNLNTYVPGDRDSTLIIFRNYRAFESSSPWIRFSPILGTYELTNVSHNGVDAKVLILTYHQIYKDTFLLNITGKQMELEVISSIEYGTIHKLTKR